MLKIRKAKIDDLKDVHKLVNEFARKGEMIPRALNELYEKMRDFFVVDDNGKISGVCALHILWEDLAEIRSLAVRKEYQGKGIGSSLLTKAFKWLSNRNAIYVNVVEYNLNAINFYKNHGFMETGKSGVFDRAATLPSGKTLPEIELVKSIS